jgi:hypothetical protein
MRQGEELEPRQKGSGRNQLQNPEVQDIRIIDIYIILRQERSILDLKHRIS